MTTPNGPGLPGTPTDPTQPQPPYNPRPSSWSSVPRSVLVGGAAAVVAVVVVVILVITMSGGSDDNDNVGGAAGAGATVGADTGVASGTKFVPNLGNAEFADGWRDKKTNEIVTPPQRIKITDSLDLTDKVESIGYGANEQSLPKIAKNAATESSFPRNPAISILADADGDLRLFWSCETIYNDPAGANCHSYNMTVDISGAAPVVTDAAPTSPGPIDEAKTALTVDVQNMAVANTEELPASVLGTDKGTGATTALVLGAVQPRESSAKVYFLVADSLKLYVGELESSR